MTLRRRLAAGTNHGNRFGEHLRLDDFAAGNHTECNDTDDGGITVSLPVAPGTVCMSVTASPSLLAASVFRKAQISNGLSSFAQLRLLL